MEPMKTSKTVQPPRKFTWMYHDVSYSGYRLNSTQGRSWAHMVEARGSRNPGALWYLPESSLFDRVNKPDAEVPTEEPADDETSEQVDNLSEEGCKVGTTETPTLTV